MYTESGIILAKVKVYVYSPDIPVGSADFTLFAPRYWNFFQSHPLWENAAYFLHLKLFTHNEFSSHLVPVTAWWTEAMWIHSFTKAFTYQNICIGR